MNKLTRRRLLIGSGAALVTLSLSAPLMAAANPERRLRMYHTHTGRRIDVAFKRGEKMLPDGLEQLNKFLLDFRTGEQQSIDPALFDWLYDLKVASNNPDGVYELISGYRSPKTNAALQNRSGKVAKRSLHMQGRAIDVRLRGTPTRDLRDLAREMKRGGVGYYAKSDFVHIDTGRVRIWGD